MSHHDVIEDFQISIAPAQTRVCRLPPQILVFGGEADASGDRYMSCRNVFLLKAHEERHPLAKYFVTPEMYREWNNISGYDNLVEFENDAGCISRAILLFLETPGAFAELGAFCMEPTLRERLLCVIGRIHTEQKKSFIYNGPIRLIQKHHEEGSLCVVNDIDNRRDFEVHVGGVLATLQEKIDCGHGRTAFDNRNRRDQFLAIIDLIDLFFALSYKELADLLTHMGVPLDKTDIKRMLWLLELFGFVGVAQAYGKPYLVATKKGGENNYLDYDFSPGAGTFTRAPFKVNVSEELKKDSTRYKAYREFGKP